MRKILLATSNPGKLTEIRAMLGENIEWVGLSEFKGIGEIKEDGATFAENARKKALGYAKATGLWTIADDSGLVIDALGGQPGVKSARFSGAKDKNRALLDHKNMVKVLKLLEGMPREKRTARFVCCLCLACPPDERRVNPEKVLIETEGKLAGFIAEKEMGTNGFGYDPIFFVPELNKTVAQLTTDEKNAISHRGNALRKLKPFLTELLKGV
jgi:XTP/dITP diphosphohydrolase